MLLYIVNGWDVPSTASLYLILVMQYACFLIQEVGHELMKLPLSQEHQALLVLDVVTDLPDSELLLGLVKHKFVHVVVLPESQMPVDKLIKEVDQKLVRGCMIHNIEPLSVIDSTQRLVHHVMTNFDYVPTNSDQQTFENLAEFTLGSPVIVDIASKVLLYQFQIQHNALNYLAQSLSFQLLDMSSLLIKSHRETCRAVSLPVRSISENVEKFIHSAATIISPQNRDVWETSACYDSWDSILQLIDLCELSNEESLLLNCLSIFNYGPLPFSIVTKLASAIAISSQKPHLAGTLHHNCIKYGLIRNYPNPVVLYTSFGHSCELESEFLCVPQLVSSCVWKNLIEVDQIAALTLVDHTIRAMYSNNPNYLWLSSICSLFLDALECNFDLIGKYCYQELFSYYREILLEDFFHLQNNV